MPPASALPAGALGEVSAPDSGQRLSVTIALDLETGGYLPHAQVLDLLVDIDKTASINRSAKALGISYATAWRRLKEAEAGLNIKLLVPKRGGASGGGTALTPAGRKFAETYAAMLAEAKHLVCACYLRYFPEHAGPRAKPLDTKNR